MEKNPYNSLISTEGNAEEILIKSVGIIENHLLEPSLVAGQKGLTRSKDHEISRDELHKIQKESSKIVINNELEGILDGIDEYSHLIVLYWGHGIPGEGRLLKKVHPMGNEDYPLVGLFGTCSPARPNPVLMTVVRLVKRIGNILEVTGLDAINGSPVIDIKPYVKEFYPEEDVKVPAWMQNIIENIVENR